MWGAITLGAIIGGTILNGLSGAKLREMQREQARKQAEYEKEKAIAARDTALGKMEQQIEQGMESTYNQVNDARGALYANAITQSATTYLTDQQNEREYVNNVAAAAQERGGFTATQGASGTKNDVNLQAVIDSNINSELTAQRQAVAGQRALGDFQFNQAMNQQKGEINRAMTAYDEGNAIMRSYRYNIERLNVETDITTSYLDEVIKDNEYNSDWFMADVFGFLGGAFGGAQQIAALSGY